MHLVDLEVGAVKGIPLQLHPGLNVVDADAASRERLTSLLGRAYVLAGSEVVGHVEGGGEVSPFDPTAVVTLDLAGDGPAVVGPSALPPPDPSPRDAARAAASAELERTTGELAARVEERSAVAARRDATLAALGVVSTELDDALERVRDLDSGSEALEDRSAVLEVERREALDTADLAAARLEELRATRVELGMALGPSEDGDTLRIGDDTSPLAALVHRAASLGGLRPDDLSGIDAWLTSIRDGTAAVRSDAGALAAEIRDIESAWEHVAALGIEGDPDVAALVAERSDIDENHRLLVGLSESGLLGDTAKSQIDAAHVVVVCAGKADEPAALAAEANVLARYGFDSYLEYTIATSTRSVGQAVEAKLGELAARVEALDAALDAARNAAARRIEELAAAREPTRRRVSDLLGCRPEGSSLEHLARVPEVPVIVRRLTVTVDEAVEAAQAEVVRYREVVTELDDERRVLEERMREIVGSRGPLGERVEELRAAVADADVAAAALADDLRHAEAAVAVANEALAAATTEHRRLESPGVFGYTAGDVDDVVAAILELVVQRRSTEPEPVVLHDTFAPLGDHAVVALESLVERVGDRQILYLTDDRRICSWAADLDPAAGALTKVRRSRWSRRRLLRRNARAR